MDDALTIARRTSDALLEPLRIPVPEAIESDAPIVWVMWDQAVRELDKLTTNGEAS